MKESAGKLFIFSFITQYLRKSTSITSMFIRVVQKLASLVSKDIKKKQFKQYATIVTLERTHQWTATK